MGLSLTSLPLSSLITLLFCVLLSFVIPLVREFFFFQEVVVFVVLVVVIVAPEQLFLQETWATL